MKSVKPVDVIVLCKLTSTYLSYSSFPSSSSCSQSLQLSKSTAIQLGYNMKTYTNQQKLLIILNMQIYQHTLASSFWRRGQAQSGFTFLSKTLMVRSQTVSLESQNRIRNKSHQILLVLLNVSGTGQERVTGCLHKFEFCQRSAPHCRTLRLRCFYSCGKEKTEFNREDMNIKKNSLNPKLVLLRLS